MLEDGWVVIGAVGTSDADDGAADDGIECVISIDNGLLELFKLLSVDSVPLDDSFTMTRMAMISIIIHQCVTVCRTAAPSRGSPCSLSLRVSLLCAASGSRSTCSAFPDISLAGWLARSRFETARGYNCNAMPLMSELGTRGQFAGGGLCLRHCSAARFGVSLAGEWMIMISVEL